MDMTSCSANSVCTGNDLYKNGCCATYEIQTVDPNPTAAQTTERNMWVSMMKIKVEKGYKFGMCAPQALADQLKQTPNFKVDASADAGVVVCADDGGGWGHTCRRGACHRH